MVLELKIPHGADWTALAGVAPNFVSYVLSFIYLAIYWNNHHHLLHTVTRVDGLILWANANLLFWLSLIPAVTAWLGENLLAPVPTATYGVALLMPAIAYFLLQQAILHRQGKQSVLAHALGRDLKGKLSPLFYLTADRAGLRDAVGVDRALRVRCGHVAGAGPPHREGAAGSLSARRHNSTRERRSVTAPSYPAP